MLSYCQKMKIIHQLRLLVAKIKKKLTKRGDPMFSFHQMLADILGLIPSRYDMFFNIDNGLIKVSGLMEAFSRQYSVL